MGVRHAVGSIFLLLASSLGAGAAVVTEVVDGDTLIVDHGTRVQLLGIDALGHSWGSPRSRKRARSSTNFAAHFLKGRKVRLEYDQANELRKHRDRWGRTLAYVYLEDGTLFNLAIIEQGYAKTYTKYPTEFSERFQAAQRQAKEKGMGLWALIERSPPDDKTPRPREIYVSEKGSRTFHKASCLVVKNIPLKDRIVFHEEEEPLKLGLRPGRWCLPVLMRRFKVPGAQ